MAMTMRRSGASSSTSSIPICELPGCTRNVYVAAGVAHNFCGRTHANEALQRGIIRHLREPHGRCARCALRGCAEQVYFDTETGRVHDFCCRRHSRLAMERGEWPLGDTAGTRQCRLPGCDQVVYKDPLTHQESDYCGRTHARLALQPPLCARSGCGREAWVDVDTMAEVTMHCSSACASECGFAISEDRCSLPGCHAPCYVHDVTLQALPFCSALHRTKAEQRGLGGVPSRHIDRTYVGGDADLGFKLHVLKRSHPQYGGIKQQFYAKWEKPNRPTIERVFQIELPEWIMHEHEQYKAALSRSGRDSNVRRRFHGTSASSTCEVYAGLAGAPCAQTNDCAACSIMTTGFDQVYAGSTAARTSFALRYGSGLYFSSVSGKSNDYSEKSEKERNGICYRLMFMCNVVVGRAFCTTEERLEADECPPPGYDSVVGEVSPGGLNYDEVVVYDNRAVIPTFLISYSWK